MTTYIYERNDKNRYIQRDETCEKILVYKKGIKPTNEKLYNRCYFDWTTFVYYSNGEKHI